MIQDNICFVFGAGEHHTPPPSPGPGDWIIAADGGYAYLKTQGMSADLVIGDFDSSEQPPADVDAIVLPIEKDDTDMMAALQVGWTHGYRRFHIYGGTGGRLDHTLANIQCLAWLAEQGGRGFLFGRETVVTALRNGKVSFPESAAGTVSVFAHGGKALGVYEDGLQYALSDATLRDTYPLGISNSFTGAKSSIRVTVGTLLLIYPKDVHETAE